MSKLLISTGTNPNDGNGDTLLAGAGKVNSNFNEIYSSLGNGSDLNIGVGKTVISTDSLGNVGVGTTNPTTKLTVKGNTSLETLIVSGVSTFSSNVGVGTTNATSALTINGNTSLETLSVSGVSTFSGNIGVGTASASSKLTVKGNTSLETLTVSGVSTFSSNVGVGTTNATSALYVVGDALITGISTIGLGATSSPPQNSQLTFELISNTKLRIKVRGTDGVIRMSDITLAP